MHVPRKLRWLTLVGAFMLVLSACGGDDTEGGGDDAGTAGGEATGTAVATGVDLSGASFTVGSKEFTEQLILGQITLQALEAAGADVTNQIGLSGSATVREALVSDEIDLYWEYTGTGWTNYLQGTAEDRPDDLYAAVAEQDLENNDVRWLEPAPLNNTYAIAAKQDYVEESGITQLSQVSQADEQSLCAASEFINRDDGLPGLEDAYGVDFSVSEMDLGLIYTQVGGECNFGEVFATDGRIIEQNLQVLEDDQDFFVPYNAALTLREGVYQENAEALEELFGPISEALTNETMTDLNAAVDVEGESPEDVAQQFLVDNGFISG